MINICLVSEHSKGDRLAFKLLDLDFPEKEYQGFQLGVEGKDMVDITLLESNLFESGIVIIKNLKPESVYKIVGRVKKDDVWTDIQSCAFITQVKRPNAHGTVKPTSRFKGGAL